MGWLHQENVYEMVPKRLAQDKDVDVIPLLWIDCNKNAGRGSEEDLIRSRLVVRERKKQLKGMKAQGVLPAANLFSATPPREALMLMCSIFMTVRITKRKLNMKLRPYRLCDAVHYGHYHEDLQHTNCGAVYG